MAPEMVPELWDKVAEWGHPCPMDTFLVSVEFLRYLYFYVL